MGEWSAIGNPYSCTDFKPSSDTVTKGEAFKQTASCLQAQEREVSQRLQDKSTGSILVESKVTETRTDTVTKTQDSVGTRMPTTLSLVTTNLPAVTRNKAFQPNLDWTGTVWGDGGSDTFDGFGNFTLNGFKIALDGRSGGDFSGYIGTSSVVYKGQAKWLDGHTFAFTVSNDNNVPIQVSMSGNLGSDSSTSFYTRQMYLSGSNNPINVVFSNDGAMDNMENDPQIWYAMVPMDLVTNGITLNHNGRAGIDNVTFNSGSSRKGFIVFIGWGYINSNQILNILQKSLTLQ